MKSKLKLIQIVRLCVLLLALQIGFVSIALADEAGIAEAAVPKTAVRNPRSPVGAKLRVDHQDDGLSVTAAANCVRLRCVFQRIEGEATTEGLWLASTVTNAANERFRVKACSVGRTADRSITLPPVGTVSLDGQTARFTRPGLVEEYNVSMDGVRQDFLVTQRRAGPGELQVQLAVSGARVEPAAGGAFLVLNGSQQHIAYGCLHVTDALGRELPARIETVEDGESKKDSIPQLREGPPTRNPVVGLADAIGSGVFAPSRAPMLAVLVNDVEAIYPVRIDPTFSNTNWVGMGGLPGANGIVYETVLDASGNLYIGGQFSAVGETNANLVAKWNGSSWSAFGSGMAGAPPYSSGASVYALAVSGSDVYAGGLFLEADGSPANYIAKWNGNSWSPLGSGMSNDPSPSATAVYALAVSGSDLYAGGTFTTAGGVVVNNIAKWDGNNWMALGSGMSNGPASSAVYALTVSGGDLYAGGAFTTAGGISANYIAKWDGTSWSALGAGVNHRVYALLVCGSDLYAGGDFQGASGSPASYVAKWNGNSWMALGSGLDHTVEALAVSGSDLYVAGAFSKAGGRAATNIAKWDGTNWTALGSGLNSAVLTLAVSGSELYAGGNFTKAGGKVSTYIARAYLESPTLSIVPSGSEVMLSWPLFYGGFVLQQNSDVVNASSWSDSNYPLTTNGTIKSAVVPMSSGTNQFFRLMGN